MFSDNEVIADGFFAQNTVIFPFTIDGLISISEE
jgi:hypothetical protein